MASRDHGSEPLPQTQSPDRVVVLGASGFIGDAVAHRLERCGLEVVCRSSESGNLLDPMGAREALTPVGPASAVVFCAAIRRTLDDSFEALTRNVRMVENVLGALEGRTPRSIVFLSSVDVYGRPPTSLPVTEATPLHPTSYYGVGKVACELLLGLPRPSPPLTVLRLPGVYGPEDHGRSVVGKLVSEIAARSTVRLSGTGSVLRDYVHVEDVATVVARCVTVPRNATLDVVTGRSIAMRDLVQVIAGELETTARIEYLPDAPTGGDLVFTGSALHAAFPDLRLRMIEEGVAEVVAALGSRGGSRQGRPSRESAETNPAVE